MSSTSYAVSAKARAKYGRFLSDRDYANILACQSVPEVMVYLKSHTLCRRFVGRQRTRRPSRLAGEPFKTVPVQRDRFAVPL